MTRVATRRALGWLIALSLAASGCEQDVDAEAGVDQGLAAAGDDWPSVSASLELAISGWSMQPGEETTRCVVMRLDNADPVWVSQIRTTLARGSHHLVVYRSDAAQEQREPFECRPFLETLTGTTYPLMISQLAEEVLTLPEGVAMRFDAGQMIRLEAHYLNYTPEPIEAAGTVAFDVVPDDRVVHEANLLFYGNANVALPPNTTHSSDWAFLEVPEGKKVFAMTGHTHQFGTNVEVEHATGLDGDRDVIYPDSDYVWDEPPVTRYDPPLSFEAGEGLRYRCTWHNPTDDTIGFGESANSEMCFVWAYYYPSDGYRICVNTAGTVRDIIGPKLCCPGDAACDAFGEIVTQFL